MTEAQKLKQAKISFEELTKRFFSRINKKKDCWEWTGNIFSHQNKGGYGYISFRVHKKIKAHRLSWMIHFGRIPIGKSVLHHCDNRKCVNPNHLFIGTQLDNMRDRFKKGRIYVTKKRRK